MPVFSFSSASMRARVPLPPDMISRNRSTSSEKPGRMMPPSRREKGGSSAMVCSTACRRSLRSSSSSATTASMELWKPESRSFRAGRPALPWLSWTRSRALAAPVTIRAVTRSRSVTVFRASSSSCRGRVASFSSFTASSRRRISLGFRRGFSIQARSIREPMGVLVLSMTQSRLPFLSLLRMVWVSSRFRRAVRSSSRYRPER